MRSLRRHRTACVLLLLVGACASGGASDHASTPQVTAPRLINADHPDFTPPTAKGDTRTDVLVMVNPDGTPDMSSLKIWGTGAADKRQAITDWLSHSTFIPGRAGTEAVRAEFRMTMMSKTVLRQL